MSKVCGTLWIAMGTPMTFTSCVVRAGWRFLSLFGHCSFPLFLFCPFGECLCVFVVGHGTRSKWSYEPPIHGRKYASMILKTTFSWEVFPKLPHKERKKFPTHKLLVFNIPGGPSSPWWLPWDPNGSVQSLQDSTTVGVDFQGEMDDFGWGWTVAMASKEEAINYRKRIFPGSLYKRPLKFEGFSPSRLFLLRFGNLNHSKLGTIILLLYDFQVLEVRAFFADNLHGKSLLDFSRTPPAVFWLGGQRIRWDSPWCF